MDIDALRTRGAVWNACVHGRADDLQDNLRRLAETPGLTVNQLVDRHATSPTHLAATHGHEACVTLLLDAKASVDLRDACGATPLLSAVQAGSAGCVRLLLERGAEVGHQCVVEAAKRGSTECVALLLASERGTSFVGLPLDGRTPLEWAEREGHAEAAEVLRVAAAAGRKRAASAEPERDDVTFKLAYEAGGGGLRRCTPAEHSLSALRAPAAAAYDLEASALHFSYEDEDGDEIAVRTDDDVREAAAYARRRGGTLRLAVHAGAR